MARGDTVVSLDRVENRLTVSHFELVALAQLDAGVIGVDAAPPGLVDAGLVTPEGVDPLAGSLARAAVAPARATVVERFDGQRQVPLFVAWIPDGRATLSEPTPEGDVVVTGTFQSRLAVLISQWVGLMPSVDLPERHPVETDTTVLDGLFQPATRPGRDGQLAQIASNWRCAWRATGSWDAESHDAVVTVVDAGGAGLWRVEHPERSGDEVLPVRLVPITMDEAVAELGDVVTGRTSPPER